MFKIEDVYVDDKKLGDLLKAMAGLVRGNPRPVPVINVEEGLAKLKAGSNSGNLIELFANYLIKNKIEKVVPKDAQNWLAKHGKSRLSSSYILKGLLKAGVVKRGPGKSSRSSYDVQRAK